MIKELLKKLGYTDEDVTKIEKGLSDEKIFLTKEENIEEKSMFVQANGLIFQTKNSKRGFRKTGSDID